MRYALLIHVDEALTDQLSPAEQDARMAAYGAFGQRYGDKIRGGDALLDRPELLAALTEYQHYHAARADLLRRAGRRDEAAAAYVQALGLCQNAAQRRFLQRRLADAAAAATA